VARLPAFIVYCSTIDACADLEDYRRAGDWTREAKTFCDDRDFSRWVGICRVHRAELWRLHGAWEVAA
ncbi:MAG: helix-turn-helix transcriptional regulator, partial [Gammaproteobacteria bacterium]|nr:helix-turn-helix transcriptional regulator [Gammaproteobacteria bacterium]NIR88814.1 helix-turn-helix transcriptional regulator [Gammaproteobacteria bacterium]NIU03721.1 helix-turn-helix transcriptional regulator [Gammaproteobacteria bacterium]NIX84995.1 helix-turn-helix transcriptional regulator [Gammaproteobacteria bacterium]